MFLAFCRGITILAGCLALLELVMDSSLATSAPQQAAAAASAAAIAIIPYVFTKMVEGLSA